MVESAMVFLVFLVLIAGVMHLGLIGLAMNSVTYAARRGARFGSTRGSSSGHPASAEDIRASARASAAPLHANDVTVTVTWTPNNSPGSTLEVMVSYNIAPFVIRTPIALRSTARQRIIQ
jgi:Flp pilus assembly protein TadG